MADFFAEIFDTKLIVALLDPKSVVFLGLCLVMFFIARKIFDLLAPYNLDEQLTTADNKAIAVSYSGYLFAVALVLYALMGSDHGFEVKNDRMDLVVDGLATFAWGVNSIFLLIIGRLVNDKFILNKFDNNKELVRDKNVGTGAVECGSFIATGLILYAALRGESQSIGSSIASMAVCFVVGQLALILFAKFYQKITAYDLHAEIEKDNVSAGVSFGMNLIAIGILISSYFKFSDSIPGLVVWMLMSCFFILASKFIVDKFVLPGDPIDTEISVDKNWGAAFIEGSCAIGVAFIISAAFLY